MTGMEPYWLINLVLWFLALVISAKGAIVAAFGRAEVVRRGDPVRLAVFLVASLNIGQTLRWLIAADWIDAWKALYIGGGLIGIYIIRLMFTYGRGPLILREPSDG